MSELDAQQKLNQKKKTNEGKWKKNQKQKL